MTEGKRNRGSRGSRERDGRGFPLPWPLGILGWTARDAVGFIVGTCATAAILVNLLLLQAGSHPAPIFKPPDHSIKAADTNPKPAAVATRSVEAIPASASTKSTGSHTRMPGEIIADIQRELSRRGYYDATPDGIYGPKTDAAIRDFERAAGLKPSAQPNEALLQAIMRSPTKSGKGTTGSILLPPVPPPSDPMIQPVAASPRVIALQRALAEFGYGQIKATGFVDADTRHAIEMFERERKLPVTGQISDGVVRELAAATGRVLD